MTEQPDTPAAVAPPPSTITPETAQKVFAANLSNILKKVKSGKTLSKDEREVLNASTQGVAAPGPPTRPKWAKTQQELAGILGLSDRRSIANYLKEKGNPGRRDNGNYPVDEWAEWCAKTGKKGIEHSAASDEAQNLFKLKAKQTALQNKRLENKLAKEHDLWMPRSIARQVTGALLLSLKARSFGSVARLATLARASASTAEAIAEIQKEMESIWKSVEESEWWPAKQ